MLRIEGLRKVVAEHVGATVMILYLFGHVGPGRCCSAAVSLPTVAARRVPT